MRCDTDRAALICGSDEPEQQLRAGVVERSEAQLVSLILTSNLPFSGWGGVFGDQAVAAAMIDRVVHHADVLT